MSFENIKGAAVKSKRETDEAMEESEEVEAIEGLMTEDESPMGVKPAGNEWWEVESGLTPSKLDAIIDTVNKLNDVFGIC